MIVLNSQEALVATTTAAGSVDINTSYTLYANKENLGFTSVINIVNADSSELVRVAESTYGSMSSNITYCFIHFMSFVNKTANPQTITLSIGSIILCEFILDGNSTKIFHGSDLRFDLLATDTLQFVSTSACNIDVSVFFEAEEKLQNVTRHIIASGVTDLLDGFDAKIIDFIVYNRDPVNDETFIIQVSNSAGIDYAFCSILLDPESCYRFFTNGDFFSLDSSGSLGGSGYNSPLIHWFV
jgi:hypothetical protein